MHGVAVLPGITPLRRGGGLHAHQRGGGQLSAGHAVDTVVYKDHGDILTPVGGGHGLSQTDGGQVAVALIGEHQRVGVAAFGAGGHGAGPPVGSKQIIVGEVSHAQTAAAYADGAGALVQHIHLLQHLADELEEGAVHTAGAEAVYHIGLNAFCSRIYLFHVRRLLIVPAVS